MNLEEARSAISTEGFPQFNLYDYREHPCAGGAGVDRDGDSWITFLTSERGNREDGSINRFDNESDALDDLVKRLRSLRVLAEMERKLFG